MKVKLGRGNERKRRGDVKKVKRGEEVKLRVG